MESLGSTLSGFISSVVYLIMLNYFMGLMINLYSMNYDIINRISITNTFKDGYHFANFNETIFLPYMQIK